MSNLRTINVELGERAYPIRIGAGWLSELGAALAERLHGRRIAVVSNPDVENLWAAPVLESLKSAGFEAEIMTIPEGEEAKNLDSTARIHDFLIERQYDRGSAVAALGGGVVGDVAGFAAATFLRGVELVQIPTSLLAMVDSSVGGKTGVNHRLGKNLIGAFKQPSFVAVELDMLSTLPDRQFRCGLAEVVKYGMIADPAFFDYLELNAEAILAHDPEALVRIVARSCEIKAQVVAEDEYETSGRRAVLNLGHTFAHAVEALSGYGRVQHGEAVAMGMVAACRLAERAGDFPPGDTDRLLTLLGTFGLPTRLPRHPVEDYRRVMASDKKASGGKVRFIVPVRIGEVALRDDIAAERVDETLEACFAGEGD